MNPPDPNSPGKTSRPRVLARLSIMAVFTCFAVNCVGNRLLFQLPGHASWLDVALGSATLGMLFAGGVLGIAGIIGGRRERDFDTVVIAGIGLALTVGTVLVMVFMLTMIGARSS